MRGRTAVLSILIVFALGITGCGGDQITADEVSVAPPTLTIPEDTKLTTASRSAGDADADASPTPTPTTDTTTGTSGTAPGTTGATTGAPAPSGTTAPATGGTTPAQPQQQAPAETGGASADQDFDEFCANNPGAC